MSKDKYRTITIHGIECVVIDDMIAALTRFKLETGKDVSVDSIIKVLLSLRDGQRNETV